jgi:tRNA A58 N-methylase Trm61
MDLVNLSPEDYVLDLGTGSAWVAIEAKRRVGDSRVCVGIDVCKELIEMDATSNVEAYKLERGNGGLGEAVHLIVGDFVDKAILDKARKLLPEGKGGFNAIFLAMGPQHINAQAARAVATPGIRFLG